MADSTRQEAQEQQRPRTAKPFEEMDEAAEDQTTGGSDALAGLKRAALTAAAGAVAAGLAGAAKAMLERRGLTHRPDDDTDSPEGATAAADDEAEEADEGEEADEVPDAASAEDGGQPAAAEAPATGEVGAGTPEDPEEANDDRESPATAEVGAAESEDRGDADDDREREARADREEGEGAEEEPPEHGSSASAGDAAAVVRQAQRELERLVGEKPERVTGFAHSDGQWSVTLEVVDMRRVPESTDVLAAYEVVFDDDRNLVSLTQQRRYRRSQVEDVE
jgi:Gas vesicle synthesis protein GvpO